MAKEPWKLLNHDCASMEQLLHDTGRWVEAVVPIKGPAKCLTIASVYGISGASSDERKKHLNESILEKAVKKPLRPTNIRTCCAGT